jgi:hypothetical protein
MSCFTNALELIREQGDSFLETETPTHLADTQELFSDHRSARTARQRALAIYEELGHPGAAELRATLHVPEDGL